MTQLTLLLPNLYALNVPMGASNIQLYCTGGIVDEIRWNIVKPAGKGIKITTTSRHLKPGNWSIICCSLSATEADAAKVVGRRLINNYPVMYRNYNIVEPKVGYTSNWRESLASLIRSKGLDDKLNWLFLKLD